jgi:recombinational DNA repair protein (RecF pathway)
MKSYYLHLRAFPCDICGGPVVSGSTAARESEIQRETEIKEAGAICLSCGCRQKEPTETDLTRHFPPVLWDVPKVTRDVMTSAYLETLSRAEQR